MGTTEFELSRDIAALSGQPLLNAELRALHIRLRDPNVELSTDEAFQTFLIVSQTVSVYLAVEAAYNQGLVTEAYYQGSLNDIRIIVLGIPGARAAWEYMLSITTEEILDSSRLYSLIRESLDELG